MKKSYDKTTTSSTLPENEAKIIKLRKIIHEGTYLKRPKSSSERRSDLPKFQEFQKKMVTCEPVKTTTNDQTKTSTFDDKSRSPDSKSKDVIKSKYEDEEEGWSDTVDFIMNCIGFAVGLGNLWRFPYLCYKNGGGAFLVPYILTLLIAGIPVAFLEHSLGQLVGKGVLGVWELLPALKGVAYATIILLFLENVYYMQLLSWSMFYLGQSIFSNPLPWSKCGNEWNTPNCYRTDNGEGCASLNASMALNCTSPVSEYWL